jgi:hypothetical protein
MRDYNGKSRVSEAIRYLVRWKGLEWYVLSKVMERKNASGAKTRRRGTAWMR